MTLIVSGFLVGACTEPEIMPGGVTAGVSVQEARAEQDITYLTLGKYMLAAREPKMALKAFLTSMSVEGPSAEAMTGAGIAAQHQGLLTSARRYFEKASELAPNSQIAYNNLGVVLYKLKEYYPARNAFRRAYALSDGKSEMAERNLNRAEATIAQMELVPETDLAFSHDVIRLGTSEFRLVEADLPEAEVTAE
ncbi:MAG: tetratricopeptide repeat protein [Alphaproteobacteria bacterium]